MYVVELYTFSKANLAKPFVTGPAKINHVVA